MCRLTGMETTTIRVSKRTRDRLAALSADADRPMTAVVDDAVDALERRMFFASFNQRWTELRGDEQAWAEIEAEREHEATTLTDDQR